MCTDSCEQHLARWARFQLLNKCWLRTYMWGIRFVPLSHEVCCLCGCHSTNNYTSRNWSNSLQWGEITEDYEEKIKEGSNRGWDRVQSQKDLKTGRVSASCAPGPWSDHQHLINIIPHPRGGDRRIKNEFKVILSYTQSSRLQTLSQSKIKKDFFVELSHSFLDVQVIRRWHGACLMTWADGLMRVRLTSRSSDQLGCHDCTVTANHHNRGIATGG